MDEITPADSVTRHLVEAGKQATALVSEVHAEEPPPANNFAFTPSQLHKLLKQRSLAALHVFGGLRGLVLGLRTDVDTGLSVDESHLDGAITFDEAVAAARGLRAPALSPVQAPLARPSLAFQMGESDDRFIDRRRIFGANRLPRRRQKSFLKLMWIAFNDKLMILLTISACISLAIGLYQSLTADEDKSNIEWVDGLTVVAAIIAIVLASAATDWQKNHRFEKLNERQQQREVIVLRSGRIQQISIYSVMVGDVLHIEAGEVVAADGILVQASSLYIDESSITGETQLVRKEEAPEDHDRSQALSADPFIFSGTTVCRGVGRFLVLSVGENSAHGRTLMSLREDVEETPLQAKLGRLGKQLIVFGAAAGAIYFLILFVRFLVRLPRHKHAGPTQKAEAFLHIVMLAITIVVITVPEGLALNVTVALAFATTRMLKDHNLVRLIRSCEIMGNATSICSDKTGTLTQNKMAVVAGRVGLESGFEDCEVPVTGSSSSSAGSSASRLPSSRHFMSTVSPQIQSLIKDSIALNSTAFERDDSAGADFFGSSTETALLKFGRDHLGMGKLREERANSPVVAMLPFDSARKWMAILVRLDNGRYRLLVKGAAEIVFEYCAYIIADPTFRFTTARLEESDRASLRRTIHDYAVSMLRPVAISFRDFDEGEVFENPDDDPASVNLEWLASGMVFIGFFGICDPIRPQVVDSVRQCQDAGVFVRMVTGDNFLTAKAIAAECGIYTAGGVAMDGPTFRKLTPSQRDAIIPRLQVLARSSPEDKLLLVTRLREMKETVAVTGDGTNDALALKAADVGFAMGVQGTEVAKEAASIILLDDNFASIVKALSWGRTVNDAVRKFIQFQFTINITAGITTVISELVGDSIFTVVQLLWINLIMDIFASLAFATDHPSPDFLMRKPEPRNTTIVNITMWKMIIGQSIYQLLVVFLVHYVGWDLFNPGTKHEIDKLQTLVFNIYVWMQFFNQHNCRRVDNKLDIWYQGILKNPWFIGVQLLTVFGQFLIIFKGGEAFDTKPLTGAQWGWSLLFGSLTIPLGALIRQVPDRYVLGLFRSLERLFLLTTAPLRNMWARIPRRKKGKLGDDSQRELGAIESLVLRSGNALLQPMGLLAARDGETQPSSSSTAEIPSMGSTAAEKVEIDLQALVDAAKLGRLADKEMLEIHPRTLKNDPILTPRSDSNIPPSQDPYIQRYFVRSRRNDVHDSTQRPVRRPTVPARVTWVEPRRPAPARTRQQQNRRDWLSWEGWLRTRRR
ncbi:p-type calcium atpase [Trichoderma cornu-damae]|uniref:Calcium-transporting ATPase n=1 Tax=Trichoderma cornu-damae TaxID=654480 RepID=A0A9P8TXS0_9HYPO|nr:p-type calcium atpase [Trichoderma cornu-damae]